MKTALRIILLLPLLTAAQEPIFMEAATQPATGLGYLRAQLIYRKLGSGAGLSEADEWQVKTRYTHGLRYDISLNAEITETRIAPDSSSEKQGMEDPRLFVKWRVLQNDLGPVNTLRGSLIGGTELPAGNHAFSSDSLNPFFGGVVTTILGRHGLNGDVIYQINTGNETKSDDQLAYDASWLYRLSPARWTPDTKASFYTVFELNGKRWEGGDQELMAGPGLLYEARKWAVEFALHLPVFEKMERRRPENFGLVTGFRYLF